MNKFQGIWFRIVPSGFCLRDGKVRLDITLATLTDECLRLAVITPVSRPPIVLPMEELRRALATAGPRLARACVVFTIDPISKTVNGNAVQMYLPGKRRREVAG